MTTDELLVAAGFKKYWFGIWWARDFKASIERLIVLARG